MYSWYKNEKQESFRDRVWKLKINAVEISRQVGTERQLNKLDLGKMVTTEETRLR